MVHIKFNDWKNVHLDGILAWIHRLVMLIAFPLRCFLLFAVICLVVFAILLIIPLYKGVPLGKIGEWYQSVSPFQSVVNTKDKILADTEVKFEAVESKIAGTSLNMGSAQTAENEKNKLATWPVAEFKRAQYHAKIAPKQKSVSAAEKMNIARQTESFNSLKPPPMRAVLSGQAQKVENKRQQSVRGHRQVILPPHASFYSGELTDYYERLENRGLIYVRKPDILYGKAEVNGPNAMSVDGTFFFLYGIYTDSGKHDIYAAEQYLRNVTAEEPVYCAVVAYAAKSQVPTALCFVNGIFINRSMVNHNLAGNVGLK